MIMSKSNVAPLTIANLANLEKTLEASTKSINETKCLQPRHQKSDHWKQTIHQQPDKRKEEDETAAKKNVFKEENENNHVKTGNIQTKLPNKVDNMDEKISKGKEHMNPNLLLVENDKVGIRSLKQPQIRDIPGIQKSIDDNRPRSRSSGKSSCASVDESQNHLEDINSSQTGSSRSASEDEPTSSVDDDNETIFGSESSTIETEWSSVKQPGKSTISTLKTHYSSSVNSLISSIATPHSTLSSRQTKCRRKISNPSNSERSFVVSRNVLFADPISCGRNTRNRSRLSRRDGSIVSNRNNSRYSEHSMGDDSMSRDTNRKANGKDEESGFTSRQTNLSRQDVEKTPQSSPNSYRNDSSSWKNKVGSWFESESMDEKSKSSRNSQVNRKRKDKKKHQPKARRSSTRSTSVSSCASASERTHKQTTTVKDDVPLHNIYTSLDGKESSQIRRDDMSWSKPASIRWCTSKDENSPISSATRKLSKSSGHADDAYMSSTEATVRVHKINHSLPKLDKATRERGLSRLSRLALPKQSKTTEATAFRYVKWGNQKSLSPISPAALTAGASVRTKELAQPKKYPQASKSFYIMDVESGIWEVSPAAMNAIASYRVLQLAKPKPQPEGFIEQKRMDGTGRSSPIWEVSEAAKNAEERSRTNGLARSKTVHNQYEPPKPLPTTVSAGAKRARASPRTEQLAQPKCRKDMETKDPQWAVSKSALKAVPSQRTLELAQAKRLASGYRKPLEPNRPVSRSAIQRSPTERIRELAQPLARRATVV